MHFGHSDIARSADQLLASKAKLIGLFAPSGYDKSALARAYAERSGQALHVNMAAENAEKSLAAWSSGVLVLEGAEQCDDEALRMRLLHVAKLRPEGSIVVTSRREPAFPLSDFAEVHRTLTVRKSDLALDFAALRARVPQSDVDDTALLRILQLSGGWPEVARFLVRIAMRGQFETPFTSFNEGAWRELFDWVETKALALLTADEVEIVKYFTVCLDETALKANPSAHRLSRQWQLLDQGLLGEYAVPPILQCYFRARHHDELGNLAAAAAETFIQQGDNVRAARIYLSVGDLARAESVLPKEHAIRTTLGNYAYPAAFLETFELARPMFALHPSLWIGLITARRFVVPAHFIAEEADALLDSPVLAGTDRLWVLAIAVILRSVMRDGRAARAHLQTLCNEADPGDDALLLGIGNFYVDEMESRTDEALACWAHLGKPLASNPGDYALGLRLASRAMYVDGYGDRAQETLRLMMSAARQSRSPFIMAAAAHEAASQAWFNGDVSAHQRFLASFRELTCRYDVPALRTAGVLSLKGDAGPSIADDGDSYTRTAMMMLLDTEDSGARTGRALKIVAGSDRGESNWLRVTARILASQCAPERSQELLTQAKALALKHNLGALVDSIDALRTGRRNVGIMQYSIDRLRAERGTRSSGSPPLAIDFMTQEVTRGDVSIALSPTAEALLLYLALHPLATRGTVTDALWPDLEGDAANNALKACLHRLRVQLGDTSSVTVDHHVRVAAHIVVAAETWHRDMVELGGTAEQETKTLSESDRERFMAAFGRLAKRAQRWQWEWFVPYAEAAACALRTLGTILARNALQRGEHQLALDIARTMGAEDALDENPELLAIEAFIGMGNTSMARAEFDRYAKFCVRELGTEPSLALRALAAITPP